MVTCRPLFRTARHGHTGFPPELVGVTRATWSASGRWVARPVDGGGGAIATRDGCGCAWSDEGSGGRRRAHASCPESCRGHPTARRTPGPPGRDVGEIAGVSVPRSPASASRRVATLAVALAAPLALAACGSAPDGGRDRPARGRPAPLTVWAAASLTRPVRAALDSFAARTGRPVRLETAASLELVRRMTELGEAPDVLLLADEALFPALLAPRHVAAYTRFARNRIVVAYRPDAAGAADLARSPRWWEVLERRGVEVGRADPATDPSGYRTLLVFQLAERHYAVPGLAARLLAAAPARNVRPREADQIALVEAGQLDYVWTYENLARQAGLPYRTLPAAVDLGSAADSAAYARARVRVPGRTPRDSVTLVGAPVSYALAVPRAAADPAGGAALVRFLLSPDGRRAMRAQALDALDAPAAVTAAPR
jgi:molybdate/tungstate transport system substrate-binding protein